MSHDPSINCDSTLGKFDPDDAQRLIKLLEEKDIHFAVEIEAKPKWGNAHAGTWIALFVPEDGVQEGNDLARSLFGVESPPP